VSFINKTLHLTGGYEAVCDPQSQIKADLIVDGGAIIKKNLCVDSDLIVSGNIIGPDSVPAFNTTLQGLSPASPTSGPVTLSGTLGAQSGGTGQSSFAVGDILYSNAVNSLTKLPIGTNGQFLTVSGGVPSWGAGGGGGVTIESAVYKNTSTPTFGQLMNWDTAVKTTPAFTSSGTNFLVNVTGLVTVNATFLVNDYFDIIDPAFPQVSIFTSALPGSPIARYTFNGTKPITVNLGASFQANAGSTFVIAGSLFQILVTRPNSNIINMSVVY
jgi:hypothetical protein